MGACGKLRQARRSRAERRHLLQHRVERERVEAGALQVDACREVGAIFGIAVQAGKQDPGAVPVDVVPGICGRSRCGQLRHDRVLAGFRSKTASSAASSERPPCQSQASQPSMASASSG
ncbi:hypothetical protein GCM10011394_15560 [Luteimonas terricola]|uniref:Uncharacterized protein n=1 Tax=Luteimonas terricola TaxID=645597 RepID=A0ABQ2ECX3_9GAMM|nr:hypothetical protein GCM10011394_15560 [Luteimonas terricola]